MIEEKVVISEETLPMISEQAAEEQSSAMTRSEMAKVSAE